MRFSSISPVRLMLLLTVSFALFAAPAGLFPKKSSSIDLHAIEEKVFEIVNMEREDAGLEPYEYHDILAELALYHSENMIEFDFFSHTDNKGMSPGQRKNKLFPEIIGGIGENIAYNYGASEDEIAENLMTQWMNSPGHKANILSTKYSHIGVGVAAVDKDGFTYYYATQNFGDLMGELLTISPSQPKYNDTAEFTFDFLGNFEKKRLTVFVSFPDKNAKYQMPDGSYYTGTGKMTLKWKGDKFSFTLKLDKGKGVYKIMMGKDGSFYPEGYEIKVK
ncbi:MAG: hypothetical protein A2Y33_12910 [Spirochaetes bacterium GWF1_51_8]|nr:MAG: hypothetical protein A2Y33_12910 [Spirochaetes bacterium GWF1_51_8]